MLRIVTTCVLAAAMLAAGPPAGAQPLQTGTITGVVQDATGGVLPGVTVTITSEERGFSRTTVTDGNGRYLFPAVPIGHYTVIATLQGFETAQSTQNLVESERATAVNVSMRVGALTDTIQVIGETPIVTPTNVTATTRVRREEFEKMPVGRTYQSLIGITPGVVGTGNVNSLGALSSNNLFIIDAVDTTDPTTGTFGTNLNFEAIQEVSILTSGVSAEYGRGQGAIVNVVTKSGTNRFEGSAKYIFLNDEWDAQNSTVSEVTGASLEREKFDKVNPVYTFTGGGPVLRDHAWFFGTWELQKNTTPQRQTTGQIPEDYQQTTESKFLNLRGTVQVREGHTAWVKYYQSPTDGFVVDYWLTATQASGQRTALTAQNQTAKNWAAQWSGVMRDNWAMEAAFADYSARIDVVSFETSGRLANAPVFNRADNRYYNGATFDGWVERPRQQFNVGSNWFLMPGGRSHDVKVGFDFQNVKSGAQFDYPNRQLYLADNYVQATNTPVFGANSFRRDYDSGDSTSTGEIYALYARDKFQVTDRVFLEAGVRWERQTGKSDLGVGTVSTNVIAPRLSGSYDVVGDGKSLVTASYGRYYTGILQSMSDAFAGIPQQTNYDSYMWDEALGDFVFANRVQLSGSTFQPNTDLRPYHMDEFTVGYQQQVGRYLGAGVRVIGRSWDNLIDDVRTYNPDNTIDRRVVNYDPAERNYRGIQFTMEKRFANNWNLQGSYTFSRTRGNHFGTGSGFTTLGHYIDTNCRSTTDLTIGTGGVISCAEVNDGANKFGRPNYDRPHNFKLNGAYLHRVGPVDLTFGAIMDVISKLRYQKTHTVNVLFPGTLTNAGPTATYFYNELGSDPVPGLLNTIDSSVEATWRIAGTSQAGFKAEIFNLFNNEEKTTSNNTAWCETDATAGCATARERYGLASARGSFVQPRRYRFSLIFRF